MRKRTRAFYEGNGSFSEPGELSFGYSPQIIQTDNGTEFCNSPNMKRIHFFDSFCAENYIFHKQIRPQNPWHNGKVERSHRSDQERFYNHLSLLFL